MLPSTLNQSSLVVSIDSTTKNEPKDATFADPSGFEIEFPFPFKPYDIQLDFMKNLYEALEYGKLGIFESPTGTGKSLSLICGALTWLRDHEERKRRKLEHEIEKAEKSVEEFEKAIDDAHKVQNNSNVSGLDWLDITGDKCKKKNELTELKLEKLKYEKVDNIVRDLRKIKRKTKIAYAQNSEIDQMLGEIQKMKQAIDLEFEEKNDAADEDIILREYKSDEEDAIDDVHHKESGEDEEDVDRRITKIYYCSRTHSQLSQFISEVKKSPFGSDARVVPLSSRQNSCINDAVLNLKSQSLINNRCIEMQKNKGKGTKSIDGEVMKKKKTTCGCPYYRQNGIETMRDNILVEISEIEDLVKQGQKLKICPYYSTRHAVPLAQLVVLPYNTLLHKSTREACGILLDGNVVIIDEAHNLLDAVSNIHSCQITGSQLTGTLSQLQQYMERYSSRFTPKNLYYIKQILFILQILIKFLKGSAELGHRAGGAQVATTVMTLNQFVIDTQIDNLNFYEILRFCKKSEISRKLMGFSEMYQPNVKKLEESIGKRSSISLFLDQLCGKKQAEQSPAMLDSAKKPHPSSPLQQVEEFFRCLNNRNEDGRIFVLRQASLETSSIKYCLMNPATHFQEIVSKAHAVIVAGGTMQPLEEFSEQLFQMAGGKKDRIFSFSCGHVIPPRNLVAMALAQGPSGRDLDFSYQYRSAPELKSELGRLILNICNVVPGGVVCFFSSYEYGEDVVANWRKSGVLEKMEAKKAIFQEPRKASEINNVLSEYSKCVWKSRSGNSAGAILFSIVGGKMSEGINFSDDLARCIIMVGMPYPNIKSQELQEKMQYLNANTPKSPTGNMPGQIYYENLCMKAVNQSIGRAIRHKDDYASILLLDKRYARPSVQNALPGWIKDRLKSHATFGPAFADVRKV